MTIYFLKSGFFFLPLTKLLQRSVLGWIVSLCCFPQRDCIYCRYSGSLFLSFHCDICLLQAFSVARCSLQHVIVGLIPVLNILKPSTLAAYQRHRTTEDSLAVHIMKISYCVTPQTRVICAAEQCLETTKNLILLRSGCCCPCSDCLEWPPSFEKLLPSVLVSLLLIQGGRNHARVGRGFQVGQKEVSDMLRLGADATIWLPTLGMSVCYLGRWHFSYTVQMDKISICVVVLCCCCLFVLAFWSHSMFYP